jgi:peroxiredoxin
VKSHVRNAARLAGLIVVCCGMAWGAPNSAGLPAAGPVGLTADPNKIVQQVADLLRNAKSLRTEVTASGPVKVQGRSQPAVMRYVLALRRPAMLAAVQKTALPSTTIVCDGKQYVSFDPGQMKYSVSSAPHLPDESVSEELAQAGNGAGTILAWALAADPADALTRGVRGVKYKGLDASTGTRCHHLQFDQGAWTRDMWVDAGEKPLVRKVSWSQSGGPSNGLARKPDFVLVFANWSIDTDLPDETFRFTPPQGAKRISASDLKDAMEHPAYGLKGEAAPAFVLRLLDGGQLNLASLKGSIVILDFWATWCPPCRQGLPILDEIARQYKDKGVRVFAINCNESPAEVRQFVTSTHLKLPVALDPGKTVGNRYSANAIPETIIIDRNGIVRSVHVGLRQDGGQSYRDALDALLAGKDVPTDASQKQGQISTEPE